MTEKEFIMSLPQGLNDDLIKENYFSLRLGLSLNDVWFIKRKYN